MASFQLAIAGGADYLELDVHLSLDRVLVVIHDEELSRTTDRAGRVSETTAAQLRTVDAGKGYGPQFVGMRVPLLSEVLATLVDARTPAGAPVAAVVEAKGAGTGAPLARSLATSPLSDRLAICSFSPAELLAARNVAPDIPTMLIVDRDRRGDDPVALARACGAALVNVPAEWLARPDVERLHAAGLLVAGGTGNDEATIRHALAIGLDAIDSDVPGLAVLWRSAAVAAGPTASGADSA